MFKEYLGENKNQKIALVKTIVSILLIFFVFYGLYKNNTMLIAIMFLLLFILFSKRVTSKEDIRIFRHTFTNLYILWWYLIAYAGALILMSGLIFAYSDPELIKYLLILSFTLAGITFFSITQSNKDSSEIEESVRRSSVMSCLMFASSGLAFLLELGSFVIKETNPLNGQPIGTYSLLKDIGPLMGILGVITLTMGVYLMIMAVLHRVKEIMHSNTKNKSLKEIMRDFVGLKDSKEKIN